MSDGVLYDIECRLNAAGFTEEQREIIMYHIEFELTGDSDRNAEGNELGLEGTIE